MIIPRFRAKARDTETDAARLLPIRQAVAVAVRQAEAELAGLARRLKEATSSAAFLFGDEVTNDADGDSTANARLSELEKSLVKGQTRQKYLQRQVVILHEIIRQLDAVVTPGEGSFEEHLGGSQRSALPGSSTSGR